MQPALAPFPITNANARKNIKKRCSSEESDPAKQPVKARETAPGKEKNRECVRRAQRNCLNDTLSPYIYFRHST